MEKLRLVRNVEGTHARDADASNTLFQPYCFTMTDGSPKSNVSEWAGVYLQAAFSPGGTRSSAWAFLDSLYSQGETRADDSRENSLLEEFDAGCAISEGNSSNNFICDGCQNGEDGNSSYSGDNIANTGDVSDSNRMIEKPDEEGSEPERAAPKRKKKKKKKKGDSDKPVGSKITWGIVEEILFSRVVANDSIPNSGGYPIALG